MEKVKSSLNTFDNVINATKEQIEKRDSLICGYQKQIKSAEKKIKDLEHGAKIIVKDSGDDGGDNGEN